MATYAPRSAMPPFRQPLTSLLILLFLVSCGGGSWDEVASLEVSDETITAGDHVRIVPSEFEPVEISGGFTVTEFSFNGTLLDDSNDLVLFSNVSLFRGSGGAGRTFVAGETLKNEEPIHWKRTEPERSVEFVYFSDGSTKGEGHVYFYLTNEQGRCMSNIVSWPVRFN